MLPRVQGKVESLHLANICHQDCHSKHHNPGLEGRTSCGHAKYVLLLQIKEKTNNDNGSNKQIFKTLFKDVKDHLTLPSVNQKTDYLSSVSNFQTLFVSN